MLTLMQILKVITDEMGRCEVLDWCRLIEQDADEAQLFADFLDNTYNIELSEIQLERLIGVCKSGKFESAFVVA